MNDPHNRLINLFGALALGVADRIRWAVLGEPPVGSEMSAAVVVIGHSPGMSIDELARVLELSHAGAVRLVDRLAAIGLAARSVAEHDRRAVALTLTEAGESHQLALLKRRRTVLADILREVSEGDLAVLERIVETLLVRLPSDPISALAVCRLCDSKRCANCPMDSFGTL